VDDEEERGFGGCDRAGRLIPPGYGSVAGADVAIELLYDTDVAFEIHWRRFSWCTKPLDIGESA
jgi:hypothetical protein